MIWLLLLVTFAFGADAPVTDLKEHTSPAEANSGEPRLTVGGDGQLYLSWIERGDAGAARLRFSRFDGTRWSAPRLVAQGSDWFVNWADFPSLAVLADGTMAAHWLQKNAPGTYSYDVRISISRDEGRTWSPSFPPHRDRRPVEHGFASIVALSAERFGVFWLDGRAMADAAGKPIPGSNMSLRYTTFDRTGELGEEILVDDRVCECCQTGAVVLANGKPLVVYRDRSKAEVRDVARAIIGDSGAEIVGAVHDDLWNIEGCPVNGPVTRRADKTLATTWYTEGKDESPRVLVAWSRDDGRAFGPPTRVDRGHPIGRVDLAMESSTRCVVTWIESHEGKATICARRVELDRPAGPVWELTATREARASGFPRLVRWKDRWILAWTDSERKRVRVGAFSLPAANLKPPTER